MFRRLLWILLPLVTLGGLWVAADWWFCLPPGETAQCVGHAECGRCHPQQQQLWTGSDHQRAMAAATPDTVLGDFQDQTLHSFGAAAKSSRRGDAFYVTTDGPTGRTETFQAKYTFGVYPLQQYLVEFPDGRLQCLRAAWDSQRQRWFHLYPDEKIPASDELHWTGLAQNWNYMCADCHTTGLRKNYDLKSNTYHTQWSELGVSCESCHGPGSLHVKIADSRRLFWDRRYGYALPRLKDKDPRVEIETCAPCHARRRQVYPGFRPGDKFLDYYLPELLDSDCYYPDGQIRDEDFEYSSFLQSKMYANQVRCSNCHDSHTLRVKFTDPLDASAAGKPNSGEKSLANPAAIHLSNQKTPRAIIKDNRLCGQCHVPSKYDTPQHHHHPDSSKPGTLCVECHMPETTYMVVDPRRDHSLRIPRPELTVSLKIPNACNGCHEDRSKGETPEWAVEQVETWYGKRNEPPHFAYAIAAGREGQPEGEKLLEAVTRRQDLSGIVRASALVLLSRYGTETGRAAAYRDLEDPDGLVRNAAVRSLQDLPPDELHRHLTPLLRDPLRAVRTEAARLLAAVPPAMFAAKDREALESALADYVTGLEALADHPSAHVMLAMLEEKRGSFDAAERAYRAALRLDPQNVQARTNLAMFYALRGRRSEAAAQFRQAAELLKGLQAAAQQRDGTVEMLEEKLEHSPPQSIERFDLRQRLGMARTRPHEAAHLQQLLAQVYYSLGLMLAENEQEMAAAVEEFSTAVRLAPENARIHYNYGLALQKLGRLEEAEKSLTAAYKLAPGANDHLHALAILYVQQKRWARALSCAEELVRRLPDDPGAQALLAHVRRQSAESPSTGKPE